MMDVDETVDSMNASKIIIIPMGEKGGSVVISVKINLNLIKIDLLWCLGIQIMSLNNTHYKFNFLFHVILFYFSNYYGT